MATAEQVVKSSLQKILVQASEAPIEASEAQDFIFSMNNYMFALDASGVDLGYTEVTDLGDTITIPTGALRGLIYNMAIEVAPEFNGVVTQKVDEIAKDGLQTMRKLGQSIGQMQYPSTLPIGSGNEPHSGLRTHHFYPNQEAEILAETTGCISLEVSTNEVAENG